MFPDPDFVKIRVKLDWTPPKPYADLESVTETF